MKKIYCLLALLWVVSCQSGGVNKESSELTAAELEELNEMSIFHLPSHWTTHRGEEIEFKDLQGKPLVVVMIYTACKAACPRLVADMRQIEDKASGKVKEVTYVLVSIDPVNDTPEKLAQFAKDNEMEGPQWLFLQGDEEGVRDFANILSVKYKKIDPIDFSHSNIISVFDEHGVLQYQKEGLGLKNDEIVSKIVAIGS